MISAFNGLKIQSMLDPIAVSATTTGTGVDRSNYGDCLMVVHLGVGATLAAGVYYTFTFEESNTLGSAYTTIADANIEGGLSGTKLCNSTSEDEQFIVRGYKGNKAFVRIVATLSGTDSTKTTMGMFAVLANPLYVPITPATEVA